MSLLKYEDGTEVRPGELRLALKALNARLHRQGFHSQYVQAWQNVVSGSDGRIAPQEAKLQVARSLYRPANMKEVDPQEWPLWGVRTEQPLAVVRQMERKRALADDETPRAAPELVAMRGVEEEMRQICTLALLVQGRHCTSKEAAAWASKNKLTSAFSLDPDEIPGQLALVYLHMMREDNGFAAKILTLQADREMPSKAQIEYEQKFADDGREKLSILENFQAKEPVDG